jgi:ubiquinol-cytochrome c reductase cytochrome b subunit
MAKAGGFFFIVFGITAFMAAAFTINPIWAYGPYDPSPVTAGSQPDWYMGWLDGAVRLTPGFLEVSFWGITLSGNILIPAMVIPGLVTMAMIFYPWIEAFASGDRREHHLLDRPRNNPTRTGLGVMAITFYVLLWISGGNDIIATHLQLSINDITRWLRVLVFVLPPLMYVLTKRICLGLQRADREKALHGSESGRVFRTEDGEVFELHTPLEDHERWVLVQHDNYRPVELPPAEDENGVRRRGAALDTLRRRVSRFYYEDRVEPVTPAELAAAHGHHGDDHTPEAIAAGEEPSATGIAAH